MLRMKWLMPLLAIISMIAAARLEIGIDADVINPSNYAYNNETVTITDSQKSAVPKQRTPDINGPPPDLGQYTQLGSIDELIAATNGRYVNYYQPAFDTPDDAWKMITDMCGPVGSWDHEIEVPYGQTEIPRIVARNLPGCVHIKGMIGPNGEKPEANVYSTKAYHGTLYDGGIFIENLKVKNVDSPNDRHFIVAHNLDISDWLGHAIITSPTALHLYVEILDSTIWRGNSQHGLYIDNVAFANIQRNRIESAGHGHALRSIAQRAVIKDNLICNAQCDGTTVQNDKGQDIYGSPPVDIYVNGETLFEGNHVVYTRKHKGSAYHSSTFRARPAIQTLDRRLAGDHYTPLLWGTDVYDDPASWDFPMIETVVKDMTIECHGEPPCNAWLVRGTYPFATIGNAEKLLLWWKENKFTDWDTLLANADPSWHESLNNMTDDYKAAKVAVNGAGLGSQPFPLAVPDGWRQKAKITFDNVTGNFEELHYTPLSSAWCNGATDGVNCLNQNVYSFPQIVVLGDADLPADLPADPPIGSWTDALLPHIPPVGEIRRIPGTEITPVLLPDDGSDACVYLKCNRAWNWANIWSGMSFDRQGGIMRIIAPGGHSDLGANTVYSFDIGSLTWTRVFDYAKPLEPFPNMIDEDGDGISQCVELETGPFGVHNYDSLVHVPPLKGTVMFRVKNYIPTGSISCKWSPVEQNPRLWIWKDSGEYERLPINEFDGYQKTVWDAQRNKIYLNGIRGRLKEIDPFTWEVRDMGASLWGGSGGVMTMEGRDVYVTSLNGGLYHVNIALDGTPGTVKNLVPFPTWRDHFGMDVSGGIVVGWDGKNGISRYNTHTGEFEQFEAPGDDLSEGGALVFSKWYMVMPGVFMGISDNDGFIIYRDR